MKLGSLIVDSLRLSFLRSFFDKIGKADKLLDVGCGSKPYEFLYRKKYTTSIGIDTPHSSIPNTQVAIFADGTRLPFKDSSFDVVLCTEVLDDVQEPPEFLQGVHKVLKPDGRLVMTSPFMVPEHDIPFDYYRYTRYGLQHLMQKSGFAVELIEHFDDLGGVIISMIVKVQLKFWNVCSKKVGFKTLYSNLNPFIFVFVYLPQIMYLALHDLAGHSHSLKRLRHTFAYSTQGFGIVARKKT